MDGCSRSFFIEEGHGKEAAVRWQAEMSLSHFELTFEALNRQIIF